MRSWSNELLTGANRRLQSRSRSKSIPNSGNQRELLDSGMCCVESTMLPRSDASMPSPRAAPSYHKAIRTLGRMKLYATDSQRILPSFQSNTTTADSDVDCKLCPERVRTI